MGGEGTSPVSLWGGAVKSLEADGLRRPLEAFWRAGSKLGQIGEAGGSVRGDSALHGHFAASEGRWDPTSPAHPLAIAVQERIDPKAFLHRRSPTKSSGLSEPFLPQQREHGIVRLALHTYYASSVPSTLGGWCS